MRSLLARLWSEMYAKWPRTIRFRLTIRYAALFLVAGSALLAISYGLVAHSLSAPATAQSHATATAVGKARKECEYVQVKKSGGPIDKSAVEKCVNAYLAGLTAGTQSQRNPTLNDLLLYSLIGLGGLTIASGGLGWLMAGRVLRPVRTITSTARRASEENLAERVGLVGPADELKELADTFDSMLDRLDAAFSSQRAFIANASHELRTPLTAMRTAIDVTLAKPDRTPAQLEAMAERVRSAVTQSESLIEALLTLARSARGAASPEFVDLATACEDALDLVSGRIKERELKVATDLQPAEITGDRLLLERMISNLVDNATRHCDHGGWIRVSSGARKQGIYVETVNSGRAISDETVSSLLEPFRRVDSRINGTDGAGLGLAIVRSVASLHGGTVKLTGRTGGGLEVLVTVPTHASEHRPEAGSLEVAVEEVGHQTAS